jgi:hypothetical protein
MNASARKLSHFGSNSESESLNGSRTDASVIGENRILSRLKNDGMTARDVQLVTDSSGRRVYAQQI